MILFNILIFITPFMSLKSIQKPVGQLQILVYLYRNEKATASGVYRGLALNTSTTYSALSHLEELKLVRKLKNDKYKLTSKGKKVAEPLNQIEKLLAK